MNKEQTTVKSKLFKLREWLTISDAARHLSIMFGEEVNEADVLRLALDDHLTLSVNFVNQADGRLGKVIPYEKIEWRESFFERQCAVKKAELMGDTPEGKEAMRLAIETPSTSFPMCLHLGGERFFSPDKKVSSIDGIWNLSMVGSERLDIEHQYQMLTNGPEVTLTCLEGAFVERKDLVCELQTDFEDNEYQKGSLAQLEEIKANIIIKKLNKKKAKKLLDQHKKDRKEYLEDRKQRDRSDNYFPAGGLPKDSVLVVRTQAIMDLQRELLDDETSFTESSITPSLDPTHPFHAKELKIALEAWTELYETNPPPHTPPGGHKKYITNWLEENYPIIEYPQMGIRARGRLSTVINPNSKGGASPIK